MMSFLLFWLFCFQIFLTSFCGVIYVANPATSIKQALQSAVEGDTILVDVGIYQGDQHCDLQISTSNISMLSISANPRSTVIDCGQLTRCISVKADNVTISGFHFTGGNANYPTGNSDYVSCGGNVLIYSSSKITLSNLIISNGTALTGGGIGIFQSPSISLLNVEVFGNGYVNDLVASMVPYGGGCYIQESANVLVQNCTFRRNVISTNGCVGVGGGICVQGGDITFSATLVHENSLVGVADSETILSDQGGAGMYFSACSVFFQGGASNISNNYLLSQIPNLYTVGSGVAFSNCSIIMIQSKLTISNNTISSTSSAAGGGLFFNNCNNITATAAIEISKNTVMLHNLSSSFNSTLNGGGVYMEFCSLAYFVGGLTVSDNSLIANRILLAAIGGGFSVSQCQFLLLDGKWGFDNNKIFLFGSPSINIPGQTSSGAAIAIYTLGAGIFNGTGQIRRNQIVSKVASVDVSGGGIVLNKANSVSIIGNLLISMNSVVSQGGSLKGAGIYAENAVSTLLFGNIVVQGNYLLSFGDKPLLGAGICIYGGTNTTIQGLKVENNSCVTQFSQDSAPISPYSRSLTNDSQHCLPKTSIQNNQGILDDGSWGFYSSNMDCVWVVSAETANSLAFDIFKINIVQLDIRSSSSCVLDYVSVYDGQDTLAPLLGKWCNNSFYPMCASGNCPPSSNISTSTAFFTVVFHSSYVPKSSNNGFKLQWKLAKLDQPRKGNLGDIKIQPTSSNQGGGIAVIGGDIRISNAVIAGNTVQHPIQAVGGGLSVSAKCIIRMDGLYFSQNSVVATLAGGGGLSLTDSSQGWMRAVHVTSNIATATSWTCISVDENVVCPVAVGAGGLVMDHSVLTIANSSFSNCSVQCAYPSIGCSAKGAAISVSFGGSIVVSSLQCILNQCVCEKSLGCTWSGGGCFYGNSGSLIFNNPNSLSVIRNNVVRTTGAGGAFFAENSLLISIQSPVLVLQNYARIGGGFWLAGNSNSVIQNCTILENAAISAAGAISVTDEASLQVMASSLVNNKAPKASVLFAFNSNYNARYSIQSTSVLSDVGILSLILGNVDISNSVWTCTHPGSVFTNDSTSEFNSLTCVPCGVGSYSLNPATSLTPDSQCKACPFGANCTGANQTSTGLQTLHNFWGKSYGNGVVKFFPCPPNYCCPSNTIGCPYNYCDGGRIGFLCGACKPGESLRFFSDGCWPDKKCNDARWLIPLMILVSAIIAVVLVLQTLAANSSGLLSVILFFYQASPLVKTTPWSTNAAVVVIMTETFFNGVPDSTISNSQGLCILNSMSAQQKIGTKFLFHATILLLLVLAHPVQLLICKLGYHHFDRVSKETFLITIVRFFVIAYTPILLGTLQLTSCIFVEEEQKLLWWWNASIECYQSWQKGAIVAAIFLSPLPLFLSVFLWKWKPDNDRSDSAWKDLLLKVVSMGFKPEKRWWVGLSLYRRFLLVIVTVAVTDGNWRSMSMISLCFLFVLMHLSVEPFLRFTTQTAETVSLCILGLLATSSSPQLAHQQFASNIEIAHRMELESIQLFLAISPIVGYICLLCFRNRKLIRKMFKIAEKQAKSSAEVAPSAPIEQQQPKSCWRESPEEHYEGWIAINEEHSFC